MSTQSFRYKKQTCYQPFLAFASFNPLETYRLVYVKGQLAIMGIISRLSYYTLNLWTVGFSMNFGKFGPILQLHL